MLWREALFEKKNWVCSKKIEFATRNLSLLHKKLSLQEEKLSLQQKIEFEAKKKQKTIKKFIYKRNR